MKNTIVFIVILIIVLSKTNAQWSKSGLYGGDVTSFTKIGSTLLAGTYQGGVFTSTDNGNTWKSPDSVFVYHRVQALASHEGVTFIGSNDGMFRSTDTGKTWKQINSGLDIWSFAINNTYLFVSSYGKGTYRITNDGKGSIIPSNQGETSYKNWCVAVNGTNVFAGTQGNGVQRSTDNGSSWSEVSNGMSTKNIRALGVLGSELFAGTDDGRIYKSINYGAKWSEVFFSHQKVQVRTFETNGNTVFAGTEGNGIYQSTDNGDSWTQYGLTDKKVNCIIMIDNTLFAGTTDSGLWKRDVNVLDVNDSRNENQLLPLLKIFQNPASNSLTIDRTSLHFPENAPVHFTLSTLVGGKVMEFDNREMKFTIPLEGIVNGVYSLAAVSGGKIAAVMVTVVE